MRKVNRAAGERMRSLSRRAAVFWLPWTLTGCSWIFMSRAPEPVVAPNYPVDCTASNAAPILDTICSGYFVVNGVVLATVNCDTSSDPSSCNSVKVAGIITSAVLAGVCGFSAASGFGYAARCQQTKDLNALCITGDFRACQTLKPGWTPGPPPQYAPPPPPPGSPPLGPPPATPPSAPVQPPAGAPSPDAPRADLPLTSSLWASWTQRGPNSSPDTTLGCRPDQPVPTTLASTKVETGELDAFQLLLLYFTVQP